MLNKELFLDKQLKVLISDRLIGNIDFRFGSKKETLSHRQNLVKFLGCRLTDLYEMEQVHGSRIGFIEKKVKKKLFLQTDALITNLKNVFLMVKTADCFPVLFFEPLNHTIAVCHVGWRGAIEKIFLKTLILMLTHFHCSINKIKVVIGPGARKCCFQHRHFLQEKLPEWQEFIKNNQNYKKNYKKNYKTLDIPSFIKRELKIVGIKRENIKDLKICTICNRNYFSHFRSLKEKETEGR